MQESICADGMTGETSAVRRKAIVAALAVSGATLALPCSPAAAAWQATVIPAPKVTDFAMVQARGRPALLVGLENGQLVSGP